MSEDAIRAELEAMGKWLERIDGKLEALSTKVLTTPVCPYPGACVPLQRESADHEKRLRVLEDGFARARGVGALARVVWGAIGGAVVAGAAWLVKHV
jgi:hypothetical protein